MISGRLHIAHESGAVMGRERVRTDLEYAEYKNRTNQVIVKTMVFSDILMSLSGSPKPPVCSYKFFPPSLLCRSRFDLSRPNEAKLEAVHIKGDRSIRFKNDGESIRLILGDS